MSDLIWLKVSEQLPKEGEIVKIKIGPVIKENVLFKDGRFWRLRANEGSGHTYEPEVWAPMTEKRKTL